MDLGDRAEDSTIDFMFQTRNTSAAPATLAGTPAISVYKANGTTESTAGVTLTADFDSRTGLNHVRIDTSSDAFYATGNDYMVVITTGTVNSVSVVGTVVATFSIDNRSVSQVTGAVGSVTSNVSANMVEISGDSGAADNLEAQYDGTGYTDATAPSSREQVDGMGAGSGGSLPFAAIEDNTGGAIIDSVTFVGTVDSGTFASTQSNDGTSHTISDTGNDIDIVYGFQVGGGRVGVGVQIVANVNGNADEMKVKAYDHGGS